MSVTSYITPLILACLNEAHSCGKQLRSDINFRFKRWFDSGKVSIRFNKIIYELTICIKMSSRDYYSEIKPISGSHIKLSKRYTSLAACGTIGSKMTVVTCFKSLYSIRHDHKTHPLTHWGRVTHICVGKLTNFGSDNALSPGRRQAIIWTNADILILGPFGTNFSEFLIVIHRFSFNKMHMKMSSAKWRPFCLCLNVLMA